MNTKYSLRCVCGRVRYHPAQICDCQLRRRVDNHEE